MISDRFQFKSLWSATEETKNTISIICMHAFIPLCCDRENDFGPKRKKKNARNGNNSKLIMNHYFLPLSLLVFFFHRIALFSAVENGHLEKARTILESTDVDINRQELNKTNKICKSNETTQLIYR